MKWSYTSRLSGATATSGGERGGTRVQGNGYWWVGLLALVFTGWVQPAAASDRWEVLQAINLVENPTNSTRMGRNGELGPYQFRQGTWKMHTKKPFYLATQREEADRIAVKHHDWIKTQLERNGIEATPYRIALAWNAGVSATINGRAPTRSHDYASRVEALTEDLKRRQLVREP